MAHDPEPFRVQEHIDAVAAAVEARTGEPTETLQTHISVVVLSGDRVFKFKKALTLPFLDFGTCAQRIAACEDELRLNRRFAPEVYLDAPPLGRHADGTLVIGAKGPEVVDGCVVMRRLPADRMLDVLLAEDAVGEAEIRVLAERIARFHAAACAEVSDEARAAGAPEHVLGALRDNFTEVRSSAPGVLDDALLDAVERRVLAALPALEEALAARAADGRVCEGHGDLHARNVCMTDPPVAYDCLEFRLDFRAGDTATDLAFLLMDLRYRGHAELARAALEAYVEASGDGGIVRVLPELVRYRAMVRAKVDAIGAGEAEMPEGERARLAAGARKHLRLAAWTLVEEGGPLVLLGCGLPATGKSTVLLAAAAETGWTVVRTDVVRKELFGGGDLEAKLPDSAYTAEASARAYAEVLARAAAADGVVLVDANFRTRAERSAALETLRAAGRDAAIVRFGCDEAVIRERLRARAAGPSVSDADEAVFETLKGLYEAPSEREGAPVVALDGAEPLDAALDRLARGLLAVSAGSSAATGRS